MYAFHASKKNRNIVQIMHKQPPQHCNFHEQHEHMGTPCGILLANGQYINEIISN